MHNLHILWVIKLNFQPFLYGIATLTLGRMVDDWEPSRAAPSGRLALIPFKQGRNQVKRQGWVPCAARPDLTAKAQLALDRARPSLSTGDENAPPACGSAARADHICLS
jgi:hypothetical protein